MDRWRKSSFSFSNGNCIEVDDTDGVRVRDSQDPGGPRLQFTPEEWAAFTGRLRSVPDVA